MFFPSPFSPPSLLRGTLGGFAIAAESFSGNVSRGVDALGLSDAHSLLPAELPLKPVQSAPGEPAAESGRSSPPSAASDLMSGLGGSAETLGRGIARGIVGLVENPLRGGELAGGWGFARGLASGLSGLVTQPLRGAADAVKETATKLRAPRRASDPDP